MTVAAHSPIAPEEVAGSAGESAMRPSSLPMILALAIPALAGCSNTGTANQSPRADVAHKTPVARPKASLSQQAIYQRLRDGETVIGKTDVSGNLAR